MYRGDYSDHHITSCVDAATLHAILYSYGGKYLVAGLQQLAWEKYESALDDFSMTRRMI
jgi:hypothetical protein